MAINVTDIRHLDRFKVLATAHWAYVNVLPSNDPNAKPFAPLGSDSRPVMYMPVKRRGGTDTFPKLRIQVQLLEEFKKSLNFKVPSLAGAEVKIEIYSSWDPFGFSSHLEFPSGKLTADLGCDVEVDADTVKKFLDPSGPMRARLNENLLSFVIEIPAIQIDGKALQGLAQNYVFLYRKKSIVFLPGVFGSQFEVSTGAGKKDAFPNLVGSGMMGIGILECDQQGEPLLPVFDKPKLLRMKTAVYDTFTKLHEARGRRLRSVPEDFLVYDLRLFAYDWRGDLTAQVKQMMQRLEELRTELQKQPDTDDQVAVAGHSTGGVLIRRMLGESNAAAIISHAFFLNVPFRGASKALSVFLTGCDPPGGYSMLSSPVHIPIVTANSLRNIVPCAPVVYHLAPSYKYPDPVAEVQGSTPPGGREGEKKGLIDAARERGMYSMRYAPISAPASTQDRAALAAGADDWGSYIDDAELHLSGQAAYQCWGEDTEASHKFKRWFDDELSSRGLSGQKSQRSAIGWNDTLAKKAEQFHRESEAAAASGAWADKAFIFYSKGHQTTTSVFIHAEREVDCGNNVVALLYPHNTTHDFYDGVAHPPKPEERDDERHFEQWIFEAPKHVTKRFWKLGAKQGDGDGTVPLRSLLGFGGPAKIFNPLPGSPAHVPAPNSDWLWDRVLEVLEGVDVRPHLSSGDPREGKE